MGTDLRRALVIGDYEVSNPLGWDGDDMRCDFDHFDYMVSNPLGWDGDPCF